MADQTLNRFLASGTEAERLAFTPDPPAPVSGPDPAYLWHETDTGRTYVYVDSAWAVISGEVTAPPPPAGATLNTFLSSGGQVVLESAYSYRVSAAIYYINGIRYTSLEQTIALDAADASLDRIDVLVLDTAGDVQKITGTAAANPSQPSHDPATQCLLAFILVQAASSTPAGAATETVYTEAAGAPGEWNWTSSGGAIVVNSSSTPHAGSTTIEGTAVGAGVYARGTKGSGTLDPNAYDHLLLFLRSKATWNSARGLLVTLRSAGVLVGAAVQIRRTGTFGFDSAITSDYQQIAIPTTAFAVPVGATIDGVQVEDFGGSIGFFLDDVSFRVGGATHATGGITQAQADALYAPLVHASRHASGGSDAITALSAAVLTSGTLPDARFPATLPAVSGANLTNLDASDLATGTVPSARLPARVGAIGIIIDGGGSAITTGVKGFVEVPFACTITGWILLSTDAAATAGSIVIDIWKDSLANYPPTVADTITASAKPTLSSATNDDDTTLSGWTTSISAGDVLGFKVDSVTTLTRVTLELIVQA